jgi:hypothetical protein
MNDDEPIPPEQLARAKRLTEAAHVELPYPSREATNMVDAICLATVELLDDPEWIARHWLPSDEQEESR